MSVLLLICQVETREDEEQNIKLTEILELLVAAGYFRARIKGLSPFDKVRLMHYFTKNFLYMWITFLFQVSLASLGDSFSKIKDICNIGFAI